MGPFGSSIKQPTLHFYTMVVPEVFSMSEGIALPVIGTIVFCTIGLYLLKYFQAEVNVPVRDSTKTHNWQAIRVAARAWYCSTCEALLLNGMGVYCDCCGVCSDSDCIKTADKKLPCKVSASSVEVQLHHWTKGNLPLGAMCTVCDEECSLEPGLVDFQCCWCQRTVHTECLKNTDEQCDFGPFKEMIVPPWCVQVARYKRSLHRHLLLKSVRDPGWDNWSPVIVIANRKSGNKDGEIVLSEFRKYLNPVQVVDLAERKPAAALQWCVLLSHKKIRVLVGGGDGTIAWVLTTAHKLDLDPEPSVAILPLGTGNDLSRVLGWGKEHSSEVDVPAILKNIQTAYDTCIDRWKVEMISRKHLGLRIPNKTVFMYNYFSIGVDAQVALNFHRTRDSEFYVLSNRIFNKLLYLCFGTHQAVTSDCKDLQKRIELYLDGKFIDLPELESIVVLNISSWGAGVDLWGLCDHPRSSQSYNDGILEVVGIYSSFHIAQLQVGLSSPLVLGQAKSVDIYLKKKSPVQVDGEPWEQHPTHIHISHVNKASVLQNRQRK